MHQKSSNMQSVIRIHRTCCKSKAHQ